MVVVKCWCFRIVSRGSPHESNALESVRDERPHRLLLRAQTVDEPDAEVFLGREIVDVHLEIAEQ